jgi:diguanylate cyclase (GGDEF)-like protein
MAACRNADQLVAAERAATLDSLTGCLNHASLQERVREEISRAERRNEPLTLVMLDLHAFKEVNETFGHLAGDEVLRTVADLLRKAVRRHDLVGRFGGDEFGLLLISTREPEARAAVERIAMEIAATPLPGDASVGVHAGVAAWQPGERATDLIERADRAMLVAKHDRRNIATAPPPVVARHHPDDPGGAMDRRLRKLSLAASIGSRLSHLIEPCAIVDAAIQELGSVLSFDVCTILRLDAGRVVPLGGQANAAAARPQDDGAVGACLRERRPVLVTDARRDGLHAGPAADGAASELAVPIYTGSDLYGAIDLRSGDVAAFDEEDAELVLTAADYVGAALRAAGLYAELEASYMGAAEALAAALEAKDNYTADHARSIADLAVEVGRRLGLDERRLRDLRYGAIFHDIGKIAVPDAILNKPGPLTDEEFRIVQRHPITGDQILAPIPFLAEARRIVRHDHERWDGAGYPDGLAGEEIPLGARIVFVVDAYHAMVSDRPYRRGLAKSAARAELRAHAGSQFDPRVVEVLLACLEEGWSAD